MDTISVRNAFQKSKGRSMSDPDPTFCSAAVAGVRRGGISSLVLGAALVLVVFSEGRAQAGAKPKPGPSLCAAGEHVVVHCVDAKGEGAALCALKGQGGAWSVAFRLGQPGALKQEFRDVPKAFVESEEAEGAHSSSHSLDYKKNDLELGFAVSQDLGAVQSVSFGMGKGGRNTAFLECKKWAGSFVDHEDVPGLTFGTASAAPVAAPPARPPGPTPEEQALERRRASCANLGKVRSPAGTPPAKIHFINATPEPVSLIWIDGNGQQVSHGTLPAHRNVWLQTHLDHAWLTLGPSGTCYGVFAVKSKLYDAVVK
jgi:hypothetical protein